MLDKILKIYKRVNFDFRQFAYPKDEFSYLFEQWVEYYKLKYAIAKALKPKSILEIGVRYGYSALTFLKASPKAYYLGLDNDTDTFGGHKGAVNWAQKITNGYNAEFLLVDTQKIETFPGKFYDLIHIDGQQDGDGTFHDLELAFEKARYILVDGFFWSNENMLSSTYFLKKYSQFIEYAITIPGYAGELLLKTKNNEFNYKTNGIDRNYLSLKDTYNSKYYLTDCGGYSNFLRTKGKELDNRLTSVYNLVHPQNGENILDLGCGRGELSYALSLEGANVVGIDYSDDAIQIAKKTFSETIGDKLSFLKSDILIYNPKERFDKVVAADVIEHIEKDSLEVMVEHVSNLLKNEGQFIIHTAPNKLYYEYEYCKMKKSAKQIGAYLPNNPRTIYEDLMHINEQTPAKLKRSLKKSFKYVVTWVAEPGDLAGSLNKNYSLHQFKKATAIYSVASNNPINIDEIIEYITQYEFSKNDLSNIKINSNIKSLQTEIGDETSINVSVENMTSKKISSLNPFPIHLCYHWINEDGTIEVFDGNRTGMSIPVYSNRSKAFVVKIKTPNKPGKFTLQITLVQEYCFWFEQISHEFKPINIAVDVRDKH